MVVAIEKIKLLCSYQVHGIGGLHRNRSAILGRYGHCLADENNEILALKSALLELEDILATTEQSHERIDDLLRTWLAFAATHQGV